MVNRQSIHPVQVTRRSVMAGGLSTPALLLAGNARSQNFARPVRIGILTSAWGPPDHVEGLVQGLVDRGYEAGGDFVVAIWFTEGDGMALPVRAQEMVRAGVDIVVPVGPLEADAAREAAPDVPLVFLDVGDPIGQGLIESLARPGGSVTGVTDIGARSAARRLQLFVELVPGMGVVLYPYDTTNRYQIAEGEAYRAAADRLGIGLIRQPLASTAEAEQAIAGFARDEVGGLLAPREVGLNIPGFLAVATLRQGIPSMFDAQLYVEGGGLASYGARTSSIGRQAAGIIDQIIRGREPAEIPTETAVDMDFVVNLEVAAALGLELPAMVLFQADLILR